VIPTSRLTPPTALCLLEATEGLNYYSAGTSPQGFLGLPWQGQEAQSRSFWYNNRYVTAARLFGDYNGSVAPPSLVSEWLPTGTSGVPTGTFSRRMTPSTHSRTGRLAPGRSSSYGSVHGVSAGQPQCVPGHEAAGGFVSAYVGVHPAVGGSVGAGLAWRGTTRAGARRGCSRRLLGLVGSSRPGTAGLG
jgi:hypothetical protein